MTTPVSFEIAKLLMEKGFDKHCPMIYNTHGELSNVHFSVFCKAPTIAEVVMWLYEKYEVWISVDPESDTDTWFHTISHNKSETIFGNCNSPTEAYSTAFDYVLNNLI
jgi:hypothetical protein